MSFKTSSVVASLSCSLVLLAACAQRHYFTPASAANIIPGAPQTAQASVSGVTVDVILNVWSGDPADLKSILTPVKVNISNEGTKPLSLRYQDFTISNPSGIRSGALPPFKIHAYATEVAPTPINPAFTYRNFLVYPYYGFYGPSLGLWPDDWGWDSGWYGTYYGYWQKNLPTADMVTKAIPEGVLNPEGNVSGYLYFQRIPETAPSLEFDAKLVDASSHKPVGHIEIPFEREK